MRILISTSYAIGFKISAGRYGEHDVVVLQRSPDWGIKGASRYAHYIREAFHLFRLAKSYDVLALLTTGMETFFLGNILRIYGNGIRVVCADFLIPRATPLVSLVQGGLRRINAFLCIRNGDIDTLSQRFAIPSQQCSFAPFPCNPKVAETPIEDHGYIYSAGWAHRDWTTLIGALEQSHCRAILSVGGNIPGPIPKQIQVLPQRSPEEGRQLMANASLVVLPLAETDLPSGPLILLDAMTMGKAIIVSDVNGSRDYVKHQATAWVIPPGNVSAMAGAISHLMQYPELRRNLGCKARAVALSEFTPERFINTLLKTCISK